MRLITAFKLCNSSVTAAAAATGGAGIPQGGMATMALVMTSVGLPADGMTYIIAVDWILYVCVCVHGYGFVFQSNFSLLGS